MHLAEEFAYLAIVLDAFSRKVIGWALQTHLHAELAIAALDMALAARRPPPGSLIHHSDRVCNMPAATIRRFCLRTTFSRA